MNAAGQVVIIERDRKLMMTGEISRDGVIASAVRLLLTLKEDDALAGLLTAATLVLRDKPEVKVRRTIAGLAAIGLTESGLTVDGLLEGIKDYLEHVLRVMEDADEGKEEEN